MKGGHQEGTQKTKRIRKVHFVALMDIRNIQKYKYIPGDVSKFGTSVMNFDKS